VLAKLRSRLTYANVVATVAVFIALGGSSYAALTVTGKNVKNSSLTGSDIKNNSVTGKDVKSIRSADVTDRSLLAKDFAAGQLPAGPKGETGAPATAYWALVRNPSGTATLKRGSHVSSLSSLGGVGQVRVTFDRDVSNCTYLAMITNADNGPNNWGSVPAGYVTASLGSLSANGVEVETYATNASISPRDFSLAVFC
jgi:hypothetical protein